MVSEMGISLGQFDIRQRSESELNVDAPQKVLTELKTALGTEYDPKFAVESLQELHLRLFADAAIAANLVSQKDPPQWSRQLSSILHGDARNFPGVVTHASGLSHMQIERCMVMLFPPNDDPSLDQGQVVSSLNTLASDSTGITHWIVDLSACDAITPEVLAYLLGFQHSLKRDSRLLLLWLRTSSVPASLLPAVQKNFRMRCKGAFLISED